MATRTPTQPKSRTDEREDFVSDQELAERWNVPYKVACVAIAAFAMDRRFPEKDPLMGKRFWPAVRKFMRARYGMDEKPLPLDGQDHFERGRR